MCIALHSTAWTLDVIQTKCMHARELALSANSAVTHPVKSLTLKTHRVLT